MLRGKFPPVLREFDPPRSPFLFSRRFKMWYVIHSDALAHHGILGQKWGKRNGPPYPLGADDHSAREKKAGWRKSLDKGGGDSYNKRRKAKVESERTGRSGGSDAENKKRGLTTGQKRAIAIGAAAVAAGLAAYGGYKLYQSGKLNPALAGLADKGRSLSDSKWMTGDPSFDGLTDEQKTFLRGIRYDALKINGCKGVEAFGELPENRQTNCGACTIAGLKSLLQQEKSTAREDWNKLDPYRVAMGDPSVGPGMSKRLFKSLIPGAKNSEAHCDGLNDLKAFISKEGDRSTGAMFLPIGLFQSPHWVQWVNVGGRAFIVDNQAGVVAGIDKYMTDMRRFAVTGNSGRRGLDEDTCLSIYSVSKEAISSAKDTEYFIGSKRR
jgi:hypothetical protein